MTSSLILGGVAIAVVLIAVWLARREGRRSAQADAAEKSVERAKDALEIDEDVARLDDDALNKQLRRSGK